MTAALAEVYALTGENAKAIELLDGLLSRPSGVTVALLRVDPAMDRLREDPGFQEILRDIRSGNSERAIPERSNTGFAPSVCACIPPEQNGLIDCDLFRGVKRRKVYRVAIAYVIVAAALFS